MDILLPRPGQKAGWRDLQRAQALGWADVYGTGPFEVVGVVDHAAENIPPGSSSRLNAGRGKSTWCGWPWRRARDRCG